MERADVNRLTGTGEWDYESRREAKNYLREVLIPGVSSYYRRNGDLPTNLGEIVPEMVPVIERPPAGTWPWTYEVLDGGGDEVSFSIRFGTDTVLFGAHRGYEVTMRGGRITSTRLLANN